MKLRLTNLLGILLFLIHFNVEAQPCATFFYTESGLTLTFKDTNYCVNSEPNHSVWNFGDSTSTDTGKIVQHTYNYPGTYYVNIKVHDSSWNYLADTTWAVSITGRSNCASASHNVISNNVQFTSTSYCYNQTMFKWAYGDGTFGYGSNSSHTYATTGIFNAKLLVYDSSYSSAPLDSVLFNVKIISIRSTTCASFSHTTNTTTGFFTNTSTCIGQSKYYWDFGDGNSDTVPNPNHYYGNSGLYKVKLTVRDSSNHILDSTSKIIVILNPTGCAAFNYTQNGNLFHFMDSTQCVPPAAYYWDFGDGNSSTSTNPIHAYSAIGTYDVVLYTYDSTYTLSDRDSATVTVSSLNAGNCASFTHSSNALQVQFTNTSNCVSQDSLSWNFGDGNYSSSTNPQHNYNLYGTYTVILTLYDSLSAVLDADTQQITLTNFNCASFTYTKNYNVVNFVNTSNCNGAMTYTWSFGDGNGSNNSNPSHTYSSAGSYYVLLVAHDSANTFIDSTFALINITMPPSCMALFSKSQAVDSNNNPIPGHVIITDLSTGNNLSYYWDFGDSTSSTLQSPSHTYSGNGPYILCLTVSDTSCTDTYCDTLSVDSSGIVQRRSPGFTIHVGDYSVGLKNVAKSKAEVKVFPNPVQDVLKLNLSGFSDQKAEIRIFNEFGQMVNRRSFALSKSESEHTMDFSQLKNGMYLLQIIASDDTHVIRIIKK